MARPSDVKSTFEKLISQNTAVVQELDVVINDTAANQREAARRLTTQLENIAARLYDTMDRDSFELLANLSGQVNIAAAVDKAKAARDDAKDALETFVAANGDEATLKKNLKEAESRLAQNVEAGEAVTLALKPVFTLLKPAMNFPKNQNKKQPGLVTAEDVAYFSSKRGFAHVYSLIFDDHYRTGRRILRDFAAKGLSTVDLWREENHLVREGEDLNIVRTQLKGALALAESKQSEYARLQKLVISDDTIRTTMLREIVSSLRDKNTFNRAAALLPQYVSDSVVESWVKAEAFERMQDRLSTQKAGIEKINGQLHKPLYNLGRTTRDVKVDLDQTTRAVQSQQVLSRHLSSQVNRANAKIKAFEPKNPRHQMRAADAGLPRNDTPQAALYDATDFLTMYMIFSLLDNSGMSTALDPAAVQMTLGIPAGVADAANINVDAIVPQLDASTLASLENMGGFTVDAGSIDSMMQDINVNVPDISVPDVSVDTGGFGGSDFGGGGGDFGGGGGFD